MEEESALMLKSLYILAIFPLLLWSIGSAAEDGSDQRRAPENKLDESYSIPNAIRFSSDLQVEKEYSNKKVESYSHEECEQRRRFYIDALEGSNKKSVINEALYLLAKNNHYCGNKKKEKGFLELLIEQGYKDIYYQDAVARLSGSRTPDTDYMEAATIHPGCKFMNSKEKSLAKADVRKCFDVHTDALSLTYGNERQKNPKLKGKVAMHLEISAEGSAQARVARNETDAPSYFAKMIADKVETFAFPPSKSGFSGTYVLNFFPEEWKRLK